MDHLSFERVNDRLDTLAKIGRALPNALRTRYPVVITPEAGEVNYWTMVSGFTAAMVVAFVAPCSRLSLICAARSSTCGAASKVEFRQSLLATRRSRRQRCPTQNDRRRGDEPGRSARRDDMLRV